MAEIRPYTSQVLAQGANATAESFGAPQAQAMGNLASAGMDLAKALYEEETQQQVTEAYKTISAKQLEWDAEMTRRANEAQPGDTSFMPKLVEDMKKDLGEAANNFSNRRAQELFTRKSVELETNLGTQAINIQSRLAAQGAVVFDQEQQQTYEKRANADPSKYEYFVRQREEQITDPHSPYAGTNAVARSSFLAKARNGVAFAAVQGYVGENTEDAAKQLLPDLLEKAYAAMTSPDAKVPRDSQGNPIPQIKIDKDGSLQPPQNANIPGWKDLTLEQQQSMMAKVIVDWNSKITVNRELLNAERKDMHANFLAGNGFSKERQLQAQYALAYGPDMAKRLMAEDANAKKAGYFAQQIPNASPEEAIRLLGRPPGPNATADDYEIYKRKQAALEQNLAFREKYPVEYVSQYSPAVKQAQAALEQARMEAQKRPAPDTQEMVKSAQQNLISASIAEQRRYGVSEPVVLSQAQEDTLAARLNNAAVSPQNATQQVQAIYNEYGRYGPAVAAQMNKKVGGLVAILGSGISPEAGSLLVEANRNKADLKKTLDKDKIKDLETNVQGALQDYFTSLQGVPNGAAVGAAYADQVGTLAMARMQKYGESQNEAVKKAADALVGSQYTFQDGYRVPKSADAQIIRRQAREAIRMLGPQDVALLPGGAGNEKDRIEAQLRAYRENGRWVTITQKLSDGTQEEGLALVIPTHGGYEFVPDKTGKPLFRSFGELTLQGTVTPNDTPDAALSRGDMRAYDRMRVQERQRQRQLEVEQLRGNRK